MTIQDDRWTEMKFGETLLVLTMSWTSFVLVIHECLKAWGGGARGRKISLQSFFCLRIFFFLVLSWWGANKEIWCEGGGRECMYIKDWFKTIFLLFLTLLPHKFKFLKPVVKFSLLAPSVISPVTPKTERMSHLGDTFLDSAVGHSAC